MDPPEGSRDVAPGTERVVQSRLVERVDETKSQKRGPVMKTVKLEWVLRVLPGWGRRRRGCVSNVDLISVRDDPITGRHERAVVQKPHREKDSPGVYRLRVDVDGERHYLHRILAWAFWPNAFAQYGEFVSAGMQGDHLCDAALRAKPELHIAGWVQAITPEAHRRLEAQRAHARKVRDRAGAAFDVAVEVAIEVPHLEHAVERASKLHDAAQSARQRAAAKRMLQGLRRALASARTRQTCVARKLDEGARLLHLAALDEGAGLLHLSWDLPSTEDEDAASAEVARLIVVSDMPERQALLAYCDRQVRLAKVGRLA